MKRKVVLKVQMDCDKCRKKAMKLVASAQGVESFAIEGEDHDQLVVSGDGIDAAKLVCRLRKKVGQTSIVTVEEVKEKKEDKGEGKEKKEGKTEEAKIEYRTILPWYPEYVCCETYAPAPSCRIL